MAEGEQPLCSSSSITTRAEMYSTVTKLAMDLLSMFPPQPDKSPKEREKEKLRRREETTTENQTLLSFSLSHTHPFSSSVFTLSYNTCLHCLFFFSLLFSKKRPRFTSFSAYRVFTCTVALGISSVGVCQRRRRLVKQSDLTSSGKVVDLGSWERLCIIRVVEGFGYLG
ncbi:hypothetical protein VNO80_14372 [Phaseolus coccineus]|uniref:Uncharacterized protein n=1 Tax=Phaseolus coccineus TaxID=3886 RepID=A0AAN9R0U3_PHACN